MSEEEQEGVKQPGDDTDAADEIRETESPNINEQPDEFSRAQQRAAEDLPHPETQDGVGNNPTEEQGGRGPTTGGLDPSHDE